MTPVEMSRDEKIAAARRMRADGKLLREIAVAVDAPRSTVSSWLDPDRRAKQARRRLRYRGTCVDCGAPTDGSNGRERAAKRCATCAAEHQHKSRTWTRETILAAFHRYFDEHGDQPSAALVNQSRPAGFPPTGTVQREFGSWSAAIRAAGWRPWAKRPTHERREMHGYVILRQNTDGAFHPAATVDGGNREAALRKYLADQPEGERGGVYATVPASQWLPRKVSVRMQPVLTFDDPAPAEDGESHRKGTDQSVPSP